MITYHPHPSGQEKNDESYDQADSWENDWSISQGLVNQARLRPFGSFKQPSKLLSIGTSPCSLVYGKACHLTVKLEDKPLRTMKLLNMDASLLALERNYQLLVLEEYRFHAYKSERLYKDNDNDAKAVGNFMQCLLIYFHAPHSVIRIRGNHFQSVFNPVFQLFGTSHRLIITYYPGPSGKEKKMNRVIKRIFEKTIDQSLKDWSIKHDRGPLILSNCLQDSYRLALHLVH